MTRRPRQPEPLIRNSPKNSPFDVYLRKHSTCAICRERDEARHHGAAHCRGNFRRQHPHCTSDGKLPRFEPDMAVIRDLTKA